MAHSGAGADAAAGTHVQPSSAVDTAATTPVRVFCAFPVFRVLRLVNAASGTH
ncbi:hypothetical protein SBD_5847 [Streptomyces bottropensis ATCC 25435]|uniref:Uncharacterized protein n=1 Tax=Streptomyces bottropensis ATCC 25435 TaxID=1054862 RepID=M3E9F8_9ACTN|nr:hypothetical protein SBD_5847 [Streptomyces bottropensis ATCC 25435]